jgi:hypothetical protein
MVLLVVSEEPECIPEICLIVSCFKPFKLRIGYSVDSPCVLGRPIQSFFPALCNRSGNGQLVCFSSISSRSNHYLISGEISSSCRNIDLTQQKTSQALSFFEKRSYLGSYQSCSLNIKVALTGLWSWMSTSSLSVRK